MPESSSPLTDTSLSSRRPAVDLGFFTSSVSTFNPRPYNPSASSSSPIPNPPAARAHLSHPLPPMDPSPSDPTAVFIHPPFTSFPDAHRYPGGLTYALLAANPEWFLDANDFISSVSNDPNAITYPSQLEPPRGWCPAKKKDLKERIQGSWPEGEEPRLRCTFCRRTYAGVNAKSMWRRHVFEKHKIAMANRRDTVDRTRKAAARQPSSAQGKENQTSARSTRRESVPAPPSEPAAKSKSRSLRPAAAVAVGDAILHDRAGSQGELQGDETIPVPSAPRILQDEFPKSGSSAPLSRASSYSATPPPDSPEGDDDVPPERPPFFLQPPPQIEGDLDDEDDPPTPTRPVFPSSPYDPRATPSFRHSPPRLPSDQPWRFPSPTHPLHCMGHISLSQVAVNNASSPNRIGSSGIEASPVVLDGRGGRNSIYSTPHALSGGSAKPTPRNLFGGLATERFKKALYQPSEESPLRRSSFTPNLSKIASGSTLLDPMDPFVLETPLSRLRKSINAASPPSTSSESESPVMRTSRLSDLMADQEIARSASLLAEPFTLNTPTWSSPRVPVRKRRFEEDQDEEDDDDDDSDDELMKFAYDPLGDRLKIASPVSHCRRKSHPELVLKDSPSTSRESSSDARTPLRKRRRTLVD